MSDRYDNKYPSVTEIIPKPEFYCTPEQLEAARNEGIDIHADIKLFLDTGDTFDIPHIETFKRFMAENEKTLGALLIYEKALTSDKLQFNGRPDLVFEKGIVDIKRSMGNPKLLALQTAGYNLLCRDLKIVSTKKWYILVINGENYTFKNVFNSQAAQIFLSLLARRRIDIAIENYFKTV